MAGEESAVSASVSPVDDGKFTAVNTVGATGDQASAAAAAAAAGQTAVFGAPHDSTPKDDWEEKTDNGKRKRSDSVEGERPEITAARIVAAQDSLASAVENEHQTPGGQRPTVIDGMYSDRERYDDDTAMADAQGGQGGTESSPQPPGTGPRRKRQFTNRTKTGCITCRRRKKKCDEGKPECSNCKRGAFTCEGYTTKVTWPVKPPGDALHRPAPAPIAPGFGTPRTPVVRLLGDDKLTPLPRAQVYASDIHAQPPQLPPLEYGGGTTEDRVLALQGTPTPSASGRGGDGRTDKDKMLNGELYSPFAPDLTTERELCKAACWRYNNAATNPNLGISKIEQGRLLLEVLRPGRAWEPAPAVAGGYMADGYSSDLIDVTIEAPFTCSYGYNIRLGKDVHIHMGCLIQDSNLVTIKDRTILSPNVSIYCAIYPMDPRKRKAAKGSEIAKPVLIEEDVWLGGNVVVLGGVTIGKGAVIGAGSVVTMDIPPFTQAAGNPAQVIRGIGYTNGIDNM